MDNQVQEAHYIFKMLSNKPIDTTVSVLNFQSYWQCANELISFSYSRLHFGHYKAASFDKDLSAPHAAKLSACANWGVPHLLLGGWPHRPLGKDSWQQQHPQDAGRLPP
jgi:hypothetical protein